MPPEEAILTVAELNQAARQVVETAFEMVWVVGELSNLSRPSSGHWYFSIKDNRAQARCAMFRMQQRQINFDPENGQQVLLRARVSIYEARGDFQLIVTQMQLAGSGALQVAFEKLKRKLDAEGLFEENRKKALPPFPKRIGVVTSATGAAIRDILSVLKRRFPAIPVLIYPTLVQGDQAAPQIVEAISTANQDPCCDVLILSRGGGSLEDLWPFNEEAVARAIVASKLPIITGVGHEVDFTIADFVSDLRAATPSAAAECVSPEANEYQKQLQFSREKFERLWAHQFTRLTQQLEHLRKRLRHPGDRLRESAQRVDQLEQRYLTLMRHLLEKKRAALSEVARALNTVSPLNTLKRGFSILTETESGEVVRSVGSVAKGARVNARLIDGELTCEVLG